MINTTNSILDLADKLTIPIIIAVLSYYLAKRQLNSTSVLQYRQKWIDDLRSNISLYVALAELISMTPYSDNKSYLGYFKEFAQAQNKVELMLEPENKSHDAISEVMEEIRNIIHEQKINEIKLNEAIDNLLDTCKEVLLDEFKSIRKGK